MLFSNWLYMYQMTNGTIGIHCRTTPICIFQFRQGKYKFILNLLLSQYLPNLTEYAFQFTNNNNDDCIDTSAWDLVDGVGKWVLVLASCRHYPVPSPSSPDEVAIHMKKSQTQWRYSWYKYNTELPIDASNWMCQWVLFQNENLQGWENQPWIWGPHGWDVSILWCLYLHSVTPHCNTPRKYSTTLH